MMKAKALAFMTILMLALTGCGKEEQEPLRVYSFSGENEQLMRNVFMPLFSALTVTVSRSAAMRMT